MNIERPSKSGKEMAEEDYERFLYIRMAGIPKQYLQIEGAGPFAFIVAKNFTMYVTDRFHSHLEFGYGVEPESTLAKGYLYRGADGSFRLTFEVGEGWDKSPQELSALQSAIKNKVNQFVTK